ncbi:MAG: phytanoyl-CoA dioxygenase family protein [Chloroflexota bacterium]
MTGIDAMASMAMSGPPRPNSAVGAIGIAENLALPTSAAVKPTERSYPRYRVSVREYVTFHDQGFLVVKGLVPLEDVADLASHVDDLIFGRVDVPGLEPPPPGASVEEIERRYLRIHMLHRVLEIHERFLLHPRVLDVLEALIGPDLMAMQSMLFIKPPGGAGQGYHQDSYYIPTIPDTLCGAWLAIDRADAENGCLWFSVGSQHEPIYPTTDQRGRNHGDALRDLEAVENVSHTDDEVNTLSRIARKYAGREVAVIADPGDVVFFAGHILHRSHRNRSADRFRRSFVGHYANARSYTRWGSRAGDQTNDQHILARGSTHLPSGLPRFGTPCAANQPRPKVAASGGDMMDMLADGDMLEASPVDEHRNDPEAHGHD